MGEVVSCQSSVVSKVFSGDPQGSAFQLRISDWVLWISRLWADKRLRYANNENREQGMCAGDPWGPGAPSDWYGRDRRWVTHREQGGCRYPQV